jgi:integrase
MPKARLTSAAVDRFAIPSTGQVEYYDTLLPAFGVRVSYSGTKAWFVMGRVDRKLTRFTLGRYPATSLAEARERAREIISHVRAGRDPRQLKRDERRLLEKERLATFDAVGAEFIALHVERHLRANTAREYRRVLRGPDTQSWGARSITSITKQDVAEVLRRIHERGSPAAANRARANLSKFFNWCLDRELITSSPTSRLRALASPSSRDRVLTVEELKLLWDVLARVPGVFGCFFAVLLLTGQRRAEVAEMSWAELKDLGTEQAIWAIPKERTKNARAHLVPLAPAVRRILLPMPRTGPLVFTTTGTTAISGFSKAKRHLDEMLRLSGTELGLPPLPSWTLHDLRRSMVTVMNERLGIAPHVVEAVVNHVSGPAKRGVAGVYNRAIYLEDRRRALEAWADFVVSDANSPRT